MTYHNAAAIVADAATAVVERAPLTRAFEIVTAAVDKRVTWPILDNARMQGDGSALFVTATNLDIELTAEKVNAAVDQLAWAASDDVFRHPRVDGDWSMTVIGVEPDAMLDFYNSEKEGETAPPDGVQFA